ncbi:short chain dehydrogenase [Fimicolochytrium jonesii]|uniref:short chain dehydrogenase n=1 Tax=Fimicolochytrium jonesii TaxID=1396493 RepID=UPI0022FE7BE6|nr:short chain dehydrogenase [Fimicolochytrium jonesii]KAI8820669.1 short chain dehydrogenase [Fimicolochytrium jonesii]
MVFGFFEKQWDATQLPDLSGKVAIVTGGNTGIGYETALHLAGHNAKVYIAARTESRAKAAIEKIKHAHPKAQVEWLPLDLLHLKSVKQAAEDYLRKESRLDILVNNAGIMAPPFELSADGVEIQFQTNHLAHFLFTHALLPTLLATSKQPGSSVRIVNVASRAHEMASKDMRYESLEQVNKDWGSTWARYAQSKLANVLFTRKLAQKLEGEKIFVNAVHPGVIATELSRGPAASYGKLVGTLFDGIGALFLLTPYKGALTQIYAAGSTEIETNNVRAQYLWPIAKIGEPTALAKDQERADNLWNLSEKILTDKGLF